MIVPKKSGKSNILMKSFSSNFQKMANFDLTGVEFVKKAEVVSPLTGLC